MEEVLALRIRENWTVLLAWRAFSGASSLMDRSMGRLTSGQRINSAADDAAGLGMSERFRGQYMGLLQANRNVMEGISMVQTAEASLHEVHTLLQRGRELALQGANGTLTDAQKGSLQTELEGILAEVDRIAGAVSYNGRRLLTPGDDISAIGNIINGLRSGWLSQAEKVIRDNYGILGDGATLKIVIEKAGPESAWITGTPNVAGNGRWDDLTLHINLTDFGMVGGPDGGSGPLFNDRKIARALTQATLARNSNFNYLNEWFVSGASDYIAGRNEQLKADIAQYGEAAIINAMLDAATGGTWVDDDLHRSAAYVAMRYLDASLQANGSSLQQVMAQLQAPGASLDTVLMGNYFADVDGFVNDFVNTFGSGFLSALVPTLNDPSDVGGVGGGDARAVIPNGSGSFSYTISPLEGYEVDWSRAIDSSLLKPMDFTLQVGANLGDTLTFSLPIISTLTLDLLGIDLVRGASQALTKFDSAIKVVSGARATLGSTHNRLEHTLSANNQAAVGALSTYSRIRDVDVAKETTNLTRRQLVVESSGAVLAQANTMRQNINWLLNGIPSSRSMGHTGIMPAGAH